MQPSNQHLSRFSKELVDFFLYPFVYHDFRPPAVRTWEPGCRPEQAANQRSFIIDLTTIFSQMRAIQFCQCGIVFRFRFYWQPGHFFRRDSYGAAAIMTSGDALKRRNMSAKKTDFLTIDRHISYLHINKRLKLPATLFKPSLSPHQSLPFNIVGWHACIRCHQCLQMRT